MVPRGFAMSFLVSIVVVYLLYVPLTRSCLARVSFGGSLTGCGTPKFECSTAVGTCFTWGPRGKRGYTRCLQDALLDRDVRLDVRLTAP